MSFALHYTSNMGKVLLYLANLGMNVYKIVERLLSYCISDIEKEHVKFISPILFYRIESIENYMYPQHATSYCSFIKCLQKYSSIAMMIVTQDAY